MRPAVFIRPVLSFTRADSRQSYAKPLDYACFTPKINIIICLSERFENSRRHIGPDMEFRCSGFSYSFIYVRNGCDICAADAMYRVHTNYLSNDFFLSIQRIFPTYPTNFSVFPLLCVQGGRQAKKQAITAKKSRACKEKMMRRPVSPCRQAPHINSFIYICSSLNTERGA